MSRLGSCPEDAITLGSGPIDRGSRTDRDPTFKVAVTSAAELANGGDPPSFDFVLTMPNGRRLFGLHQTVTAKCRTRVPSERRRSPPCSGPAQAPPRRRRRSRRSSPRRGDTRRPAGPVVAACSRWRCSGRSRVGARPQCVQGPAEAVADLQRRRRTGSGRRTIEPCPALMRFKSPSMSQSFRSKRVRRARSPRHGARFRSVQA